MLTKTAVNCPNINRLTKRNKYHTYLFLFRTLKKDVWNCERHVTQVHIFKLSFFFYCFATGLISWCTIPATHICICAMKCMYACAHIHVHICVRACNANEPGVTSLFCVTVVQGLKLKCLAYFNIFIGLLCKWFSPCIRWGKLVSDGLHQCSFCFLWVFGVCKRLGLTRDGMDISLRYYSHY